MQLQGYNGFPSMPITVMANAGVRGEGPSGTVYHSNMFFCSDGPAGANIEKWADEHRELLGTINPNDSTTWVKAWDGIYLSSFSNPYDDTRYNFEFTVPNVSYVNLNNGTNGNTQNQTFTIGCYRNYTLFGARVWGQLYCIMGDRYYDTYSGEILTVELCDRFFEFAPNLNTWQPSVTNEYLNGEWYNYGESLPTLPPFVPSQEITKSYYYYHGYVCTDFGGRVNNERQEGDNSTPGGGGGNYGYEESEVVPDDGIPTVSAISSGFISLYNPSPTQLVALRDFLYNANSSVIEKLMALTDNVFNYLVSLKLFPCIPNVGSSKNIAFGGVDSEVQAPELSNQYKSFDCGKVNVEECYGGFLDYTNTTVKIYLPFCGEMELDTPIVMHGSVYLLYKVDFLTGDCMACITVKDNHGVNAQVYFANGNCACEIPITGRNDITQLTGILGVGLSMATGSAIGGVANAIANPEQFSPKVQRVGNIGGAVGMLGQYTPYIIIERPAQSFPLYNNMLLGRPSNIGGTVGSFSGYTEIDDAKLDGIQATDAELDEIRQLLADGVYI